MKTLFSFQYFPPPVLPHSLPPSAPPSYLKRNHFPPCTASGGRRPSMRPLPPPPPPPLPSNLDPSSSSCPSPSSSYSLPHPSSVAAAIEKRKKEEEEEDGLEKTRPIHSEDRGTSPHPSLTGKRRRGRQNHPACPTAHCCRYEPHCRNPLLLLPPSHIWLGGVAIGKGQRSARRGRSGEYPNG